MITYTWKFPSFDVAKSEDGLTDVVKAINWQIVATEDKYLDYVYGQVVLSPPNPSDFTPYDQLTELWAIDQVSAFIDVNAMELSLAKSIENQKNPPVVPMPPPFG